MKKIDKGKKWTVKNNDKCYLRLSMKGIRLRGEKFSGIQGPPGFVGKRWFGPIIPLIIGILGNMGFPAQMIFETQVRCIY